MRISIKRILNTFPNLEYAEASLIKRLLKGDSDPINYLISRGISYCNSYKGEVTNILTAIDDLLDNHGIESVRGECWDNYYGDSLILYSNAGDTYNPTFLYDVIKDKFYLTTLGDYLERCKYRFN